jgi:GntR family transcriptional regulator
MRRAPSGRSKQTLSACRRIGGAVDSEGRAIDRASPIPFYYQLQEILKEEIERGTWRPGELLPSEADLEYRFGVSRTVIRQALNVLESDGQIARAKGRRSMVAEPKFRWEATIGAKNWRQHGPSEPVTLGRFVDVRRVLAGGHVGHLLGMHAADAIFEITFTQDVSGRPVALSQMYLRPQATAILAELWTDRKWLPAFHQGGPNMADQLDSLYGIQVAVSDVTIELTTLNEFEADLLSVPTGSHAFLLSSLDLDPDDAPISFVRTVIRGDQFRFSLSLHKEHAVGATRSPSFMTYLA